MPQRLRQSAFSLFELPSVIAIMSMVVGIAVSSVTISNLVSSSGLNSRLSPFS